MWAGKLDGRSEEIRAQVGMGDEVGEKAFCARTAYRGEGLTEEGWVKCPARGRRREPQVVL